MHKVQENLERHMTELCLRIGSRHIGSPGEAAAANYIEQTFREYGYPTFREAILSQAGILSRLNFIT